MDSAVPSTKKMRISKSVRLKVNELLPIPPIPTDIQLGEDELSLIFRELSTRDLLNLRLVSRIWRDAATSTLLRRDACYIDLDERKMLMLRLRVFPHNDNDDNNTHNETKSCFWHPGFNKEKTVTELIELMSKSLKFPASTFHVRNNQFSSPAKCCNSILIMFFKLHGDKIRTLCLRGTIFVEPLLDILSKYTPNIESLDLSEANLRSPLPLLKTKMLTEENDESTFFTNSS